MPGEKRLTLKQIRAIDAVASARGFAEAANRLATTQPAISRTVASAENLLGVPLFQRGWGGTEPTALGEGVLRHCSNALKLIQAAEDDIEAMHGIRPRLATFLRSHHLDAIAAVITYGGASAASRQLGITQPAVSRAIGAATEYSKQPLFERKRDGLEAKPQARRLKELHDALERELTIIEDLVHRPRSGLIGRLAVGMLPFSGQDLIARAFGELTKSNPDLRLIAVPGSYSMLAEALRRGELDCMVGVLRNPAPYPDLRETYLYEETFTLVARCDHPCHQKNLSIADLRDESWIVAQHGTPIRSYFETLFRSAGAVPPAQTCEIHSFTNAEKVILNSNSIALLCYGEQQLKTLPDGLKKLDVHLPDSRTAVGITYRKAGGPSDVLRCFEKLLRDLIAETSGGPTPT
ncbi:LysR family transcriptional regulator [Roseibium aggregatum]|uniref:LysR family transcriptional regulator n=1 Tax=Roseibium aggregatum TaxID=187304 RepID=A0A926S7S0_9HYPH|nr:LysR family transcriptional regulator [Roseibium aggregatum]MBD1548605.1 LysR family transcriptional regulator [Roseibium aggregatum]